MPVNAVELKVYERIPPLNAAGPAQRASPAMRSVKRDGSWFVFTMSFSFLQKRGWGYDNELRRAEGLYSPGKRG
jgi:hypothetical protein